MLKLHKVCISMALMSALALGSSMLPVKAHHLTHHQRVNQSIANQQRVISKAKFEYIFVKHNHLVSSYHKPKHIKVLRIRLRPKLSKPVNRVRLKHQKLSWAQQARKQILKDINLDREKYGVHKLILSKKLRRISYTRNPEVNYGYTHLNDYKKYPIRPYGNPSDRWIHGYDTHQSMTHYINKYNYHCRPYGYSHDYYWGETAADTFRGNSKDDSGTKFSVKNGKQGANVINYMMMYDDNTDGNNNAHRKTILGKQYRYYNAAAYYNHRNHLLSIVENFSS